MGARLSYLRHPRHDTTAPRGPFFQLFSRRSAPSINVLIIRDGQESQRTVTAVPGDHVEGIELRAPRNVLIHLLSFMEAP